MNCMQVMHKFIPFYIRKYDSAAILIVYLPISDDCTMLYMFKHAVQNYTPGNRGLRKDLLKNVLWVITRV